MKVKVKMDMGVGFRPIIDARLRLSSGNPVKNKNLCNLYFSTRFFRLLASASTAFVYSPNARCSSGLWSSAESPGP